MRILAILVCSLLIPVAAFSQAGNGTITGTITDSTGATVAGAAVEVKNAETGVIVPAVSTATGAYTAPNLQPGAYSVELRGVASNCTVSGSNPRPVTVTIGATADAAFAVTCARLK